MKWKIKAIAMITCVILMGSAVHFIYSVYTESGQLTADNESLNTQLSEKNALITSQEAGIQHLAELNATRLQELVNAKSKITQLRDNLHTHVKRVYVKVDALCLKPLPPPAWMVQDPPDWRKTLNRIMYISSENLKPSKPSTLD
ncbi:lysis system i-spanin subunit Rz [Xenorhabdus szentirmaii]|uniref:Uncharacterized protein n=1 Tax=Xenorhabdus szentirmaii DSM 16338 TaxID=1427518 RepID=W1IXJ3_9GAMM|nr:MULTISPECIES: lysis system i-spanin subunit Rz [Xenorhabdus]MBD2826391.1 lysis protein [Xenorhabdus sp. 5]PHM33040.1 lysis protein [Xenorhabdus szentirmaii DSM 16338]CDL82538.1 exported hypothetical protein [Xenorhabdus szentirmaii DSM 16338]